MDMMDKRIIARLLGCSRTSYRSIANDLGVACPTVQKRVERLRQWGVIQRFCVEMSHQTLGVDWVLADVRTNSREEKGTLLNNFDNHECIREVLFMGSGEYLIFAEASSEEATGCREFFGKMDCIDEVSISPLQQIPIKAMDGQCNYATAGDRAELDGPQLDILRCLLKNARTPVNTISKYTGYAIKQVRGILQQLQEHSGVHFTIRLNLPSSGDINFLLGFDYENKSSPPTKTIDQLSYQFPKEHWFSTNVSKFNTVMNYMIAKDMGKVEDIIDFAVSSDEIKNVETKMIFSSLKSDGRTERYLKDYAIERMQSIGEGMKKQFSGL